MPPTVSGVVPKLGRKPEKLLLKTALSVAPGTPLGDQLDPKLHAILWFPTHDLSVPKTGREAKKSNTKVTAQVNPAEG